MRVNACKTLVSPKKRTKRDPTHRRIAPRVAPPRLDAET